MVKSPNFLETLVVRLIQKNFCLESSNLCQKGLLIPIYNANENSYHL